MRHFYAILRTNGAEMKNAFQIYITAFANIIGNFGSLFKLIVPSTLTCVIILGAGIALTFQSSALVFYSVAITSYVLLAIVVSGYSARFHRYFLLDERRVSWAFFDFNWQKAFGYLGYSILIGLILLIPIFIGYLIGAGVLRTMGISKNGLYAIGAVAFIFIALIYWLYLRLAMILPAYSIDQNIGFRAIWKATRSKNFVFFWVMVFGAIALAVLNSIVVMIGSWLPPITSGGTIYVLLIGSIYYVYVFFVTMVTLATISELYKRTIGTTS